jgi:hypothetical protein
LRKVTFINILPFFLFRNRLIELPFLEQASVGSESSDQPLSVPLRHIRNAPSLSKAFTKGIDGALGSSLCLQAHSAFRQQVLQ